MTDYNGTVYYQMAYLNNEPLKIKTLPHSFLYAYVQNLKKHAEMINLSFLDFGLYAEDSEHIYLSTRMSSRWLEELSTLSHAKLENRIYCHDEVTLMKLSSDKLFLNIYSDINEVDKKWILSAKIFLDFCANYGFGFSSNGQR